MWIVLLVVVLVVVVVVVVVEVFVELRFIWVAIALGLEGGGKDWKG